MEISWPQVAAAIINFAILYLILKHFLFKPVNNTIDKRQNEIKLKIQKTDEDKKLAEELKLENEKILSTADKEGKTIVEQYKQKAEVVSADVLKDAHGEAETIMKRAKKEVEREKEKAADEMKQQIIDLAVILSSKALGETIDEGHQRKLMKEFIAKVGI
jgi:F-type H+-transporting ATPase subunit b